VNYYEHHIGDYEAETAHLSLVEDAIYHRMIRRYYRQEGPLPVSVEAVARLCRASDQVELVKALLLEFFTLADDGWHQGRCDKEIIRYREKQEKARNSALAGVAARQRTSERSANADQTLSDGTAPQSPVPSPHAPVVSSSQPDGCPHAEIIAAYHEALPANPPIKTWTDNRQKNLRARWREDPKRQSLDYWRRFFAHIAASEFLTGRRTGPDGRPFLPGLDWLVKPDNFAKVIEGRYHDRSAA